MSHNDPARVREPGIGRIITPGHHRQFRDALIPSRRVLIAIVRRSCGHAIELGPRFSLSHVRGQRSSPRARESR